MKRKYASAMPNNGVYFMQLKEKTFFSKVNPSGRWKEGRRLIRTKLTKQIYLINACILKMILHRSSSKRKSLKIDKFFSRTDLKMEKWKEICEISQNISKNLAI